MPSSDSEFDENEDQKGLVENVSSDTSSYEDEEIKDDNQKEDGKETTTLIQLLEEDTPTKMESPGKPVERPLPRRKRFIPKYECEGVFRVTLSEETQMAAECLVGVDLNAQYPWKMVKKSKVLENIELLCEGSDFFPCNEALQTYEDDELLIGYINDEQSDIDEFYICCTAEAREHCKQQSDRFIRRQEKKLEKAVQKRPRPWTCLGSDVEITSVVAVNARPLMEIEINATFPRIYQPEKFNIRDTNSVRDGFIELTPYRQKFNVVLRRRVDCGIQASPEKNDNEAQTVLRYPKNMWTQSIADAMSRMGADTEAGGDAGRKKSKGVLDMDNPDFSSDDSSDDDNAGKYKEEIDEVGLKPYRDAMKRLRRPSYIKMINKYVSDQGEELNTIVELNTVMDMYCNDYPKLDMRDFDSSIQSRLFKEYICFTDVRAKDKYVSSAAFHPFWSGIVATAYSDGSPTVMKVVGPRPDPIQRAVYGLNPVMIWSHIDSLIPKLYLEAPREVKFLTFCPFDENLLIGGCINGQIIVWDLTNKIDKVETLEVLSETREKYKIAMNAHMTWMKHVSDKAVLPATALSSLLTSHYGPITSISWLSPNFTISVTGKMTLNEEGVYSLMCLSTSEDGTILIWNLSYQNVTMVEAKKIKKSKRVPVKPEGLVLDVSPYSILDRNLQPCFKIILGTAGVPINFPAYCMGMNHIDIEYIDDTTKTGRGRKYYTCKPPKQNEDDFKNLIYLGSLHGELTSITWTGHDFNTGEVVNASYADFKFSCRIHDGIITAVHKNPFLKNITLSVGGKIFAIWSDDISDRPLIWKKRPHRLTDGKWSLYKPSLLFISTSEGTLESWDLLIRSDKPIAIQTLSGNCLTSLALDTLPINNIMIGVSDTNGAFQVFLDPPSFRYSHPTYKYKTQLMLGREFKVLNSFLKWQEEWTKNHAHIFAERNLREKTLLEEKEELKKKQKEEEEARLEEEAEARRLEKMRIIGPAERWQMIIQKLIEKTIAVKKRINRAQLYEEERPLRELEAQRLEKERRMLDIMRNQKAIFNDTVAILFPEALKKEYKKSKTDILSDSKEKYKKEFLHDYKKLKEQSLKMVKDNPYYLEFNWDATLTEGKERREALNADNVYVRLHKTRLETEAYPSPTSPAVRARSPRQPHSMTSIYQDTEQ